MILNAVYDFIQYETIILLKRATWQTGMLSGNDYFKPKAKAKLNCKVGQS